MEHNPYSPGPDDQPSPHDRADAAMFLLHTIRNELDTATFIKDLRNTRGPVNTLAKFLLLVPADNKIEKKNNEALGIYLDTVLNDYDFWSSIDENQPQEAISRQEDKLARAYWATERVAYKWLKKHPESQAAKNVLQFNIWRPPEYRHELLQEIWPAIASGERIPK
jgi:hypothetical protein